MISKNKILFGIIFSLFIYLGFLVIPGIQNFFEAKPSSLEIFLGEQEDINEILKEREELKQFLCGQYNKNK